MRFAPNCPIDLKAGGHYLVQANTGGGKSHALRLLLEQTHGHIQQLVIDPEGEFATLREKFDYVICAPHGGDAVAHPVTATLLARRLLETRASAILNIYDLKAHERVAFVKKFCEELIDAPRELWHPVLIVLDEAHIFCPEKGSAESAGAVIDIATRGRKRGYSLVMATQRLSKLNKDAAAETLNKLIGRTGLDIDVKRAADELGFSGREAAGDLRRLVPGEFFAYGAALTPTVTRIKVDPVKTTHPKAGGRQESAPPPPSAAIRAIVAKGLQDIPKEAENEARTVADLKAELAKARGALTLSEKRTAAAGVPEKEVARRIAEAVKEARSAAAPASTFPVERIHAGLRRLLEICDKHTAGGAAPPAHHESPFAAKAQGFTAAPSRTSRGPTGRTVPGIPGQHHGAVRILQELAARLPAGYTHAQVGTLTRFKASGGTFKTYFGALKRAGLVEVRDGLIYATRAGVGALGAEIPRAPTSPEEAMDQWRQALHAGAFRILQAMVDAPDGATRSQLAAAVGMQADGGTFKTYFGILKRNGLIEEHGGICRPSPVLQPMGVAA
jgi:hypothetical protein